MFDVFAYLALFLGAFSMLNQIQGVTLIYFIIVTLGTIGYGDYFLKGDIGQSLSCFFIITSIVYIPLKINDIIGEFKLRYPFIVMKKQTTNGVLFIGKFSKSFSTVARNII